MSVITSRGQLIFRLYDKLIASPEVIDFLSQMLRHQRRRHLVVVMDQAPPHVAKVTKAYIESQPRLHVFHLPTYSPDWNSDEKVCGHRRSTARRPAIGQREQIAHSAGIQMHKNTC